VIEALTTVVGDWLVLYNVNILVLAVDGTSWCFPSISPVSNCHTNPGLENLGLIWIKIG
jgi:hypothetical protein